MRADMQVSGKPVRLGQEQVDVAVRTFSLLAESTRVKLLWCLLSGEHGVTQLAEMTGAAPSAVSQHLAKLRLARLVRYRRDGRRVLYSADNSHVRRLLEESLYHADHVAQGHADHP
jgi:DNA-binding transcriptional ArsR family regulator